MCRILGITAFDLKRHRTVVERFCDLAHSGVVMADDPPGHEDGWGLAFYRAGELTVHKSGASLLAERDKVIAILKTATPSPLMILHLRKSAWGDRFSARHAHPFHDRNKVFFHNGVVYDYQRLLPALKPPGPNDDALDTEVLFHHVLSGNHPDLGRNFLDTVALVKKNHDFSALNCLFSDGMTLFAYRDYTREPDYYSLYKAFSGHSCLISSEPLDPVLTWDLLTKGEFLTIDLQPSEENEAINERCNYKKI